MKITSVVKDCLTDMADLVDGIGKPMTGMWR
jgi:hypothetical protein